MVFVKDFPRMRAFYSEMLGRQPLNTEWTDKWAHFDAGGTGFDLHAIPAEMAAGIQIASPPKSREQTATKLLFEVADVAAERARMEAMGIQMLQRPWGELDGVDPEGNVFGIRAAGED